MVHEVETDAPARWVGSSEARMLIRALDTQLLTLLERYRQLGYPLHASLELVRYVMDRLCRSAGASDVAEPRVRHDSAYVHDGRLDDAGARLMREVAAVVSRLLSIWSEARTLEHVQRALRFWHVRTRLCLDRWPRGPEAYTRWRLGECRDRRPPRAFGHGRVAHLTDTREHERGGGA